MKSQTVNDNCVVFTEKWMAKHIWTAAVCLLAALAMATCMAAQDSPSQKLWAQRAGSAFGGMQSDCLGQRGLPHGMINRLCKPVLPGVRTSQPSNDLAKNDQSGTFITFDAPGSTGMITSAINPAGIITGYYSDANFITHGFVRAPDGTITTFDIPGAPNGTYATAINPAGTITGGYVDADFIFHSFLRDRDGTTTTFEVPGAVFGAEALAINPAGATTGIYLDPDFVLRGFVRASDGVITTFDAGGTDGTNVTAINPAGTITGSYGNDGFLRSSNGTITTFEISGQPTIPFSINPAGTVTGQFREEHPEVHFYLLRGFIRRHDGTTQIFDAVPSPLDPCCTWTMPSSINSAGDIAGTDNDSHTVNHGFLRTGNGSITILDAPEAGTGFGQGTSAVSINPLGQVAGYYLDANGLSHGFLWSRH